MRKTRRKRKIRKMGKLREGKKDEYMYKEREK